MQSFRTEFENPFVEKDILELERKIRLFKEGKIDEEKFRSLRLARGVYGQRQPGVQMIRIKLPYGQVSSEQLLKIADVSDEYSTGRLHITTRQDIQIHYVSLDRTPELWAALEQSDITLREACGNTVRNVTASELAGIDKEEPFDVSPYAEAVFQYFLRNPISQELGRKFKIAFSSSEKDTALTYMHDLGFIPKLRYTDKGEVRGFKVLLGGGLGSQPRQADVVHEFLPTNEVIPFAEGVVRVFDRYGERNRRLKARLKFLINDLGIDAFLKLVEEEKLALQHDRFEIDPNDYSKAFKLANPEREEVQIADKEAYNQWLRLNVQEQKQDGYYAIGIRVPLGDFYTDKARKLALLVRYYAGDEVRFTLRQNILIPNVKEDILPYFYQELEKLGFVKLGYNSFGDITACPGTDTCNLGISSSTGIARELERIIEEEYPELLANKELTIKISGCMNACGQHMMAHIGFQGMTIKSGTSVAPALQVLLGGGTLRDGEGRFADKIIKVPSKRGPFVLRALLHDFQKNGESFGFLDYYDNKGSKYFYDLLKPIADSSNLLEDEFVDWGNDKPYVKQIGVGECAGVIVDLIATLFVESEEKLANALEAFDQEAWSDSIYHAYASFVNSAKALLLATGKQTNTQANIIQLFEEEFSGEIHENLGNGFAGLVYQIKENKPNREFAQSYLSQAQQFLEIVQQKRAQQIKNN